VTPGTQARGCDPLYRLLGRSGVKRYKFWPQLDLSSTLSPASWEEFLNSAYLTFLIKKNEIVINTNYIKMYHCNHFFHRNHFSVYSPVELNAVTLLGHHYHHPPLEPCPLLRLKQGTCFPFPLTPGNPHPTFCLYEFEYS
jgi:hypothetical protein